MVNVVKKAVGAGSFKTLVAAGLGDMRSGIGPFGVRAPSDNVLAKQPAGTLAALLADLPRLTGNLTDPVAPGQPLGRLWSRARP